MTNNQNGKIALKVIKLQNEDTTKDTALLCSAEFQEKLKVAIIITLKVTLVLGGGEMKQ